jgi:hypothetical protein
VKPRGVLTANSNPLWSRLKMSCEYFGLECYVIGQDSERFDWKSKNSLYHLIHHSPFEHTLYLPPTFALTEDFDWSDSILCHRSNFVNFRSEPLTSSELVLEWQRDAGAWSNFMVLQEMSEKLFVEVEDRVMFDRWSDKVKIESHCDEIKVLQAGDVVGPRYLNGFQFSPLIDDPLGVIENVLCIY